MASRHSARRLPVDTGRSGWLDILGEAPSYPELEEDISADVVIIGAGFAGLSAARRLAEQDTAASVVILEAASVASGPAGRNSGFMIDLPHELGGDSYVSSVDHDKQQIALNRKAQDFALSVAQDYEMPAEAVQKCGRINAAVNASGQRHNLEYAAHLDRLGEAYTHYSEQDMQQITGSSFYSAGLFMPGTIMLQPALYITRLAEGITASMANRVRLFENSPALELLRDGTGWVVTTPKGRVRAGAIILAVNGHANSFGFFKNRLMHVFTYASMTERLDTDTVSSQLSGEKSWNITPSDPMGTTIRRIDGIGGNRIIVRNRWTVNPSLEVTETHVSRFADTHRKSFVKRYPQLADVSFSHSWAGRLCLSLNSVPAFGEIDHRLYSACCQNGLGTAKGTLAGMAAADMLCGRQTDILNDMISAAPPKRLPPRPVSTIGANAVITFREFKARDEL